MNSSNRRPLAIAAALKRPCFSALLLPLGAPVRGAQPWLRQRRRPSTGGRAQSEPSRRRAPQLSAGAAGGRVRLAMKELGFFSREVKILGVYPANEFRRGGGR
jgi:hypothetical protein